MLKPKAQNKNHILVYIFELWALTLNLVYGSFVHQCEKICFLFQNYFLKQGQRGDLPRLDNIVLYYLISTCAPAASSSFLKLSTSALETPSFSVFGAPSTRSLASFKPRPVIVLTSLITLILSAPEFLRIIVNSVFSSAGAAPAATAAPATWAATATGAAAVTPNLFSNSFTSSAISITVELSINFITSCFEIFAIFKTSIFNLFN